MNNPPPPVNALATALATCTITSTIFQYLAYEIKIVAKTQLTAQLLAIKKCFITPCSIILIDCAYSNFTVDALTFSFEFYIIS